MVAIETIHYMKCKTNGKTGEVALKIDISKAYDRVDWGYLRSVLIRLGFKEKWVKWMGMCVETVHYSVLMNGEKAGSVAPGRGLRQGDPLSPYLFILCAEGLTSLLKNREARGEIHGIKVCRGAPILTHLLFADDCFLFCRATDRESRSLKEVLEIYEQASGQSINLQKSEIFFSRNTSQPMKDCVITNLGVTECLGTGKYLGLPSMVGRSKKQLFGYLRDRLWNRIHNWSGRHLSKAGREVLIKSVAQAIPAYCMSTFLIPTTLGEEMERMINSFWWGSNRGARRGINWLSWDKLTMRKEYGGMGFRHFHGFNLAMLGKQGWRLCTNPDAIVSRVFKAKYFPTGNFLEARLGHNPSYVWRSIHTSQVLLKFGARWKIGDGNNINVWKDPWLKGDGSPKVTSHPPVGAENTMVSALFDIDGRGWNIPLLNHLFNPVDRAKILNVSIRCRDNVDSLVWNKSRDGYYSVKSAYYVAMNELIDTTDMRMAGNWNLVWNLKVPHKVRLLLWRCLRGVLPCRANLRRRHVPCTATCAMCDGGIESEWHLFFACPKAVDIWRAAGFWNIIEPVFIDGEGFNVSTFHLLATLSNDARCRFAMLIWCLWKRRNERVWDGIEKPTQTSVQYSLDYFLSWQHAQKSKLVHTSGGAQQSLTPTPWTCPVAGSLKCNVDAGIYDDDRYAIGLCLRDAGGNFVKAKTLWFTGRPHPQEAEAIGLLEAITWLRDLGTPRATIELDCKAVVDGLRGSLSLNTEYGSILNTCRNLLSNLENYCVSFVRRQANLVAHTLARAARNFASIQVFDRIPSCIATLILNEIP